MTNLAATTNDASARANEADVTTRRTRFELDETTLEVIGANGGDMSDAISALAVDMRILASAVKVEDPDVHPADYGFALARLAARADLLEGVAGRERREYEARIAALEEELVKLTAPRTRATKKIAKGAR